MRDRPAGDHIRATVAARDGKGEADAPSAAGEQAVGETEVAVGLSEHERQPHPDRRQAGRASHVAAAAEHDLGSAPLQQATGGAHGAARLPGRARSLQRVPAVEAADAQEIDLVARAGDEVRLGAPAGTEEADLGALSAKRVGDGDRRHDVSRRAAGRYHDSCHLLRAFFSWFRPPPLAVSQGLRPCRVHRDRSRCAWCPWLPPAAWRHSGSARQQARVRIRLVPPYETNGRGTPVSGARPSTANRLRAAWAMISEVSPAASSLLKRSLGAVGGAKSRVAEHPEEADEHEHPDETELLADHRGDHVGVGLRQVRSLLHALAETDSGQPARADSDRRLLGLETGAAGVAPRVEEAGEASLLVGVHRRPSPSARTPMTMPTGARVRARTPARKSMQQTAKETTMAVPRSGSLAINATESPTIRRYGPRPPRVRTRFGSVESRYAP